LRGRVAGRRPHRSADGRSGLSELDEAWGFEVNGSLALAYGPPSAGIEEPLERLEAFARLIEEAGQRRAAQATSLSAPTARPRVAAGGPRD
jgi:hypothetical protein